VAVSVHGMDNPHPEREIERIVLEAGPESAGWFVMGLAGVVDQRTAFENPLIAPRWHAANTNCANVAVKYTASAGYVCYHYRHDSTNRSISIDLTGSGELGQCHLLFPEGTNGATSVFDGEAKLSFDNNQVEESRYVDFDVSSLSPRTLVVNYA